MTDAPPRFKEAEEKTTDEVLREVQTGEQTETEEYRRYREEHGEPDLEDMTADDHLAEIQKKG